MSNKQFTVPTGSAPGSGGGGGSGTVTSVAMTGDGTVLNSSVTGSPVTTAGTLAPSLKTQTANTILAGPTSGGAVAPTFRSLVVGDLPAGTGTVTSVAMSVNSGSSSGILAVTGSPVTTSGTLNVNLSGTSGGVPYFSDGTTLSSSGALTANRIVVGGGAGATPTVLASLGTTTTILHGNAGGAPTFGAVDLTADVTGVLPPANGGVANSSTVGIGGFLAGWDSIPNSGLEAGAHQVCTAANVVDAYQFTLQKIQVVGHITIRMVTTFGVGSNIGVAIYDSAKNRIITTGAQNGTAAATFRIAVGPVTMNPGVYWIGISTDGGSPTTGRVYNLLINPSVGGLAIFFNNADGNRIVTGNTASVGGVPPATLGTLSAQSTTYPPAVFLEP